MATTPIRVELRPGLLDRLSKQLDSASHSDVVRLLVDDVLSDRADVSAVETPTWDRVTVRLDTETWRAFRAVATAHNLRTNDLLSIVGEQRLEGEVADG